MAVLSTLVVKLVTDYGGLVQGFDKASAGVKKFAGDTKSTLTNIKKDYLNVSSMVKDAAGTLEAAWNATIVPAMRAQKIDAATAAVIKSTGGAAGVSAQQVKQYADELMNLSGVDDETVRGGENMLLTFTNIGSEVFPLATRTMTDMAVAMNEGSTEGLDLKSTAIQLGKALNDPIAGISALAEVGVTFTAEQKDTIKQMLKMNDVAGAQGVILNELQREFGGAAEAAGGTFAGKLTIAQQKVDELKEAVGQFMSEGISTGIDVVSFPQQLSTAFTESALKIREQALSGQMSVTDYNNAITGMANGMSGVFGPAATQALIKQYALNEEMVRAAETTDAADRSTRRLAEAQAAQTAQAQLGAAQQAEANSTHTAIMRSYSSELLYNVEQYQAQQTAAENAAAAEAIHRGSIAESITANASLAQSLKDATTAQATQSLATAQLDTLKKAYEDGTISQQGYEKAAEAVMLRYGLATPVSIAMADAQTAINQAFLDGDLPLKNYIDSTGKIPQIAKDGKVTMQELADLGIRPTTDAAEEQRLKVEEVNAAWGRVPATVTTTYKIITEGDAPSGGSSSTHDIPSRALGGPTGSGGLFLLHPDEWVLSAAQRMGNAPIPAEALPSGAPGNEPTSVTNINLYDTLTAKMFLEQQRATKLQRIADRM